MADARTTFLTAAGAFVDQVARIPLSALTGPGLGDWDLRSLVGHTSRSLVTVETYLDQPATEVAVPTAADYYVAIASALGAGGPAIVERGRLAGLALGDDPASFVHDLAARVRDRLAGFDPTYLLTTIAGGMPLEEYLRTRTFELVVHGLDIAAALGLDPDVGPAALREAAGLATAVVLEQGRGADLLLTLTGRADWPADLLVVR